MAEQFEGEEFVFPDEKEVQAVDTGTPVPAAEDLVSDQVEVDIVDDTPEADRDRIPLPAEVVQELEKDELTDYSERVKTRMSQLKKVWHDERRAKEAADREREEAIRFAQSIVEENKRLKSTLTSGEQSYIEVAKKAAEHEMNLAKREYREAYDSGDTDRLIEAQQRMTEAQFKLNQTQNYKPKYESALQEEKNEVYIPQERPQTPKPDLKALGWQERNTWFGQDEEMTSLALGLHEKLVRSGISPTSDDYYRRIDDTMRKRFPEYFGDSTLDEEVPAQRTKPPTVVAPATRSTAPKKVQITKSAAQIIRKLGVSPEQYAREALKLENK